MRIFDETKTTELAEVDLAKGRLQPDKLFIAHHEAVAEQWHREVVRTYPNGGKLARRVVDVPAREAFDEYEDIQVYVPYTPEELATMEIEQLKAHLSATDYKAIKYAEGLISAEEYEPIKNQRQAWRDKINELEGRT